MFRYLQSAGLSLTLVGVWSIAGWAQVPDVPIALIGERAALQNAVCNQDWATAVEASDRLLALDELPASYRGDMAAFHLRLLQFQEAEVVLPVIPGCEDAEDGFSQEDNNFSEQLNNLAGSITSPLTQDIVQDVGSDNLIVVHGVCSILSKEEIENPMDLMVATVEQNFFGLPFLELDELDEFREGNREQQEALVEYLSFMAFLGSMQFCQENIPVVETVFGVEIPDVPAVDISNVDASNTEQ